MKEQMKKWCNTPEGKAYKEVCPFEHMLGMFSL
jgi:hypothetical protein